MCMEACLWLRALIQVVSWPPLTSNSLSAPFTLIMTKLNLQESNFFQEGKIRLTLMGCFKSLLFILFYILYYILLCSQDRPVAHCAVQAGWNLGTPCFCLPKAGLAGMCHRSHCPAVIVSPCCVSLRRKSLWSRSLVRVQLLPLHLHEVTKSRWLVSGVWVFR